MCQQEVPRFGMSIRDTFSNINSLPVTNEYDKGAVMEVSTVPGHVKMLLVEWSSETGLFRHLSNHVFRACIFGNIKAVTVIFLFKIFKIYCRFQKVSKKFSSAANVLTSNNKIWHVKNRDFFQLN